MSVPQGDLHWSVVGDRNWQWQRLQQALLWEAKGRLHLAHRLLYGYLTSPSLLFLLWREADSAQTL